MIDTWCYDLSSACFSFSDAFDLRYGVGILRLRTGLDLSHLSPGGIDGTEISPHSTTLSLSFSLLHL